MSLKPTNRSTILFEQDETAWLEEQADLIRANRIDDLDLVNLAEYLSAMAR